MSLSSKWVEMVVEGGLEKKMSLLGDEGEFKRKEGEVCDRQSYKLTTSRLALLLCYNNYL